MFNKYYTANIRTINGEKLRVSSVVINCKLWHTPKEALKGINDGLQGEGFVDHKVYDLKRIK